MKLPRAVVVVVFALVLGASAAVASASMNAKTAYASIPSNGGGGGFLTVDQGGVTVDEACSVVDNDDDRADCYNSYITGHIMEPGDADNNPATAMVQRSDQPGRFRTGNYDIGYDDGGTLNFAKKMSGAFMNILFGFTKTIVGVGLWFIQWAFRFELVFTLSEWADGLEKMYNAEFIAGSINLHFIFFVVTAFYGAYNIVRGRFGKGIGEIIVSGAIFAILLVLTASPDWPGGYMRGGFHVVGGMAGEIMQMAQGTGQIEVGSGSANRDAFYGSQFYGMDLADQQKWKEYIQAKCRGANFVNSSDPDKSFESYQANYSQIICPALSSLHKAFIDEPQRYAEWGSLLSGPDYEEYRMIADNTLISGTWAADSSPRYAMQGHTDKDGGLACDFRTAPNDKDCSTGPLVAKDTVIGKSLDSFNNNPSPSRLMVVVTTFIASVIAMCAIIALCAAVGLSQFVAAILFALAPFALAAGLLPGSGRSVMTRWFSNLLKVFVMVLVLSNFLVLMTAGLSFIMENTADQSLYARFSILIIITIAFAIFAKKMHQGTNRSMAALGNQLMQLRVGNGQGRGGGSQPWPHRPMAEHQAGGLAAYGQSATGQRVKQRHQARQSNTRMAKMYKRNSIQGNMAVLRNNSDKAGPDRGPGGAKEAAATLGAEQDGSDGNNGPIGAGRHGNGEGALDKYGKRDKKRSTRQHARTTKRVAREQYASGRLGYVGARARSFFGRNVYDRARNGAGSMRDKGIPRRPKKPD